MGHANVGDQSRLWTITEQLTQGITATITTEEQQRALTVEEAAVEIKENPFPYDGLFVVLHDCSSQEYSLLVPEDQALTPRLISPDDRDGESVTEIDVDDGASPDAEPSIAGKTATELGIPVR